MRKLKITALFTIFIPALACLGNQQGTGQTSESDSFHINIDAGAFDRVETVVSFPLPDDLDPGVYTMTGSSGEPVPVQVDSDNKGWFILDYLPAGSTESYVMQIRPDDMAGNPAVSYVKDEATLTFTSNGYRVLSYYYSENDPPESLDERYRRGGYIHPVLSPSGTVLTNHLNVDQHPHHSGIWSAWTRTRFDGRAPDFWNMHDNTGRVDVDTLLASWDGPVHAGFTARNKFIDFSGGENVTALKELWDAKIYPAPSHAEILMFDLELTQSVDLGKKLVLPEYHYGGLGFRGHIDWDDPDNIFFLTSEGLGREDGHATRARWAHIGGYSEGELAGIAILVHPTNYRFPQPMRIHPGESFFNYAPMQLGDMTIEPGKPYHMQYRFITYDGEPDPELIDRLWNDYAYPPGVTVSKE